LCFQLSVAYLDYLPRFGVPAGLQLAIDQLAIYLDLESPTAGRDERERLDPRFKSVQQFGRETRGAIGIPSNCAVFDSDFGHG